VYGQNKLATAWGYRHTTCYAVLLPLVYKKRNGTPPTAWII